MIALLFFTLWWTPIDTTQLAFKLSDDEHEDLV